MPVKTGRLAEFRRALDRIDPSSGLSFDPQQHISSSRSLPPDLADQLRELDTDDLLDILRGNDAELSVNRDIRDFVGDLVRLRATSDDLREEHERDFDPADTLPAGPEEEQEEFFVGWTATEDGHVEMASHSYHPSNRAQVSHETLQRYRDKVLSGGMVGRVGNKSDLAQAIRVQQQNDRWRGRTLQRVGEVKAEELKGALKAVLTPRIENLLLGQRHQDVTLALDGRNAVLLTRDGDILKLNRTETRHLALVGILPRHWFLPLMWWKRMLAEQESSLAEQGKSKKRIYKGRYDDEDVQREQEEDKER